MARVLRTAAPQGARARGPFRPSAFVLAIAAFAVAALCGTARAISDLECLLAYRTCDQCMDDSGCVWCEDPHIVMDTRLTYFKGACVSGSWTGPGHNTMCATIDKQDLCFTCGGDWRYGQCTMRSVVLYAVVSAAFVVLLVAGALIVYRCFCRARGGYTVIA